MAACARCHHRDDSSDGEDEGLDSVASECEEAAEGECEEEGDTTTEAAAAVATAHEDSLQASAQRYHARIAAICAKYETAEEEQGEGLTMDEWVTALEDAEEPAKRVCLEPVRHPPADKAQQQLATLCARFDERCAGMAEVDINTLCRALDVHRDGSAVRNTLIKLKDAMTEQGCVRFGVRGVMLWTREAILAHFLPELASRELKLS